MKGVFYYPSCTADFLCPACTLSQMRSRMTIKAQYVPAEEHKKLHLFPAKVNANYPQKDVYGLFTSAVTMLRTQVAFT